MEEKKAQVTEKKQIDPRQRARENIRLEVAEEMKSRGVPPKELTDEELDNMIKARIAAISADLKKQQVSLRVEETYAARIAADMEVLLNVDLEKAETEWHRKIIQADIDEMKAIIAQKEFDIEKDRLHLARTQKSLQKTQDLL